MTHTADEVAELTAVSRELWDQRKAGLNRSPVESLTGFSESLRRLTELHEYSDVDIGIMFGVSHERVRQWRNRLGIKQKRCGSGKRMWNQALGRFVTVSGETYNRVLGRRRTVNRRRRWLQTDIDRVREAARRVGRTPTIKEVFPVLYPGTGVRKGYTNAAARWGYKNGLTYEEALDRLWTVAGFDRGEVKHRGENHYQSKLTEQAVRAIRHEHAAGKTLREIGQKHGVGDTCVLAIVRRHTWKHVP